MTKRYIVLKDSKLEPKATVGEYVYDCHCHDYGCADDDSRATGIYHISVTLDPNGGYPFFTIPYKDLREDFTIEPI